MPYADKTENNACKREWERRQKANNTPYWQRKKKRISKRKSQKRRDRLRPVYVRELLNWPNAPLEIVELKRMKLRLKRAVRNAKKRNYAIE